MGKGAGDAGPASGRRDGSLGRAAARTVSAGTKETVDAYGITEQNVVLHVPVGGDKVILGDVQADGNFVAKVKAEYCDNNNNNCVIA